MRRFKEGKGREGKERERRHKDKDKEKLQGGRAEVWEFGGWDQRKKKVCIQTWREIEMDIDRCASHMGKGEGEERGEGNERNVQLRADF